MPSPSDDAAVKGERLVHLDCESSHLALLLGLVDHSRDAESYDWIDLSAIIKLGVRYHFHHVPALVHQPASYCVNSTTALAIFHFAGAHGFFDLAKLAVADFADTGLGCQAPDDMDLSFFDQVSPRYAVALVLAMAKHLIVFGPERYFRWQKISASYKM